MGMIPSRREDRGLTPLRLRAWISVSAAAYFRVLALYLVPFAPDAANT